MTDFLIAFSILMLILTLVSERISNFLKLFLQGKYIYFFYPHKDRNKWKVYLRTDKISILSIQQPTKGREKEREYRILTINIIIGFVVATIFNANLFQIFEAIQNNAKNNSNSPFDLPLPGFVAHIKVLWFGAIYLILILWIAGLTLYKHLYERGPRKQPKSLIIFIHSVLILVVLPVICIEWFKLIFWKEFQDIIKHILGYIGTGLFLSLGSKFWHDFLDLLFRVKNTKQIANDPSTYTNYSSADQIVNLEDTIRDKVAELLYNKYQDKIDDIEGVLSHGLNYVLDHEIKVHKKVIEIEYNRPAALEKLTKLKGNGSVTVNYNTFYLKDFMVIQYSENLEACLPDNPSAGESKPNKDPASNKPKICAYNKSEPDSFGSFGVIEKVDQNNGEKKYFAVSNLHVFANTEDLKNLHKNNENIAKRQIKLKIGDLEKDTVLMNDYRFQDINGNGYDYGECEIDQDTFDKFNKAVNIENVKMINHLNHMNMFGAMSGEKYFLNSREGTVCNVNYGSFTKKLYLYKAISTSRNVQKGDSGSLIYYRSNGKDYMAMLVAKSDHYAYIQLLNFLK